LLEVVIPWVGEIYDM